MLEFQEGFFEQEIRDGFYLDTTMKTVWAAEMEVLQKVAEVCDKYGLTWYAAYGTLMGAIRHEGFVPWDDDMDIWLLRRDYNKLMKVLPKELPEGYRVRGPLAEEEYDQFHTCVNSGSQVSIAPDWLEQFHGCPFTVGMDIFPLDYLPRNEKDRKLQKELFLLAGRVAQMARNMANDEYDAKEGEDAGEAEKRKKKVKQEIKEGMNYLKKSCKLPVNRRLFEEEKWYSLSSELWKWGNHIAMMYGEEESDYLVMYMDYAYWEIKKFPKEWFGEVYGAAFENFMLPVPAGYDQILKRIYGDYRVHIKKVGMHDYPYYAKQLEQLKEYVKRAEDKLGAGSAAAIEDIKLEEVSREIPEQWLPGILKADGSRKKLILSANDPMMYAADSHGALDKLEKTFGLFKARSEEFTLWWRPHPAMKKILDQTSPEAGERYQRILDRYKSEGWGICDESDKTECAVENCDAYYGDKNAVLQPFQNAGKPIMIAHTGGEDARHETDTDVYLQNYLYLSCPDFVMDEKKLYFSNRTCNALVIVDRATWTVESMVPFIKKGLSEKEFHLKCCRWGNKIYFLPQGVNMLHVYNMDNGEQEAYELTGGFGDDMKYASWGCHIWQENMYLLPSGGGMGLWKLDADGHLDREDWWKVPFEGKYFVHGSMDEKHFFSLETQTRCLTITDLERHTARTYDLPDERVFRVTYDGRDFWCVLCDSADIVRWNPVQGESVRYHLRMWDKCNWAGMPFAGIHAEGEEIFLVSGNSEELFLLDKENGCLKKVFEMSVNSPAYTALNKGPFFIRLEDKLIWILQGIREAAVIDLRTLEGKMYTNAFPCNENVEDYFNRVLLEKDSLFLEDSDWTLEKYLDYCGKSAGRSAEAGAAC